MSGIKYNRDITKCIEICKYLTKNFVLVFSGCATSEFKISSCINMNFSYLAVISV